MSNRYLWYLNSNIFPDRGSPTDSVILHKNRNTFKNPFNTKPSTWKYLFYSTIYISTLWNASIEVRIGLTFADFFFEPEIGVWWMSDIYFSIICYILQFLLPSKVVFFTFTSEFYWTGQLISMILLPTNCPIEIPIENSTFEEFEMEFLFGVILQFIRL